MGFGGISVGGISPNRKQFGALLPYVDHLPHTHGIEANRFARGMPEEGAHLADALENLVALHGGVLALTALWLAKRNNNWGRRGRGAVGPSTQGARP